ncbi:formyltransferase family protein [Acuticoccus yangtzensis]|uniref:formyltransferase family protein n=1 Tax=Acuticoccus yangtzensis TaxID=1443441 RepID=UPI000949A1A2|nr:formyltransferase family protein [Acuticoccus yangtzensis]
MNVLLTGQKAFGAAVFEMLRRGGFRVNAVSAPALREDGVREDRLRAAAERAGVPWILAGTLRAETLPAGTDLIVAAHSHDFVGRRTRMATTFGAIGYHPSLLPRHRGRDAVRWTIHMKDPVAGGSVYWLSERMDGGDIAAQDYVFVSPGETVDSLWREKLFPLGLTLLERAVKDIAAGIIRREPQDEAYATWEPSWERAPALRPELDLIGTLPEGARVSRKAARG